MTRQQGCVSSNDTSARPYTAVDASAALAMPGVAGYFGAGDVPHNEIGPVVHDEQVFASEYVTCVGHQIGIVVADTHEVAMEASRLVQVHYEMLPAGPARCGSPRHRVQLH